MDKEPDGKVQIQVIGDEDLYGKDYIVEPDFETGSDGASTPNPGYAGDPAMAAQAPAVVNTTTAEISLWPVVQFIFVPSYNPWRSPWYWSSYPPYWRPWEAILLALLLRVSLSLELFYNSHYRRWHTYRVPGWRDQYYGSPFRSQSIFVRDRFTRGDYRRTYSRPQLARKGAELFRRIIQRHRRCVISFPLLTRPGDQL